MLVVAGVLLEILELLALVVQAVVAVALPR
jgi:hypothetical protein